jgi:ABC-type antimicrobial peptide transport system permease subunit
VRVQPDEDEELYRLRYNIVSPSYFSVLRLPFVRGRNFTDREAVSEASIGIVSESAAQRLWPGQDPLGKQLRFEGGKLLGKGRLPVIIVGVAKDVATSTMANSAMKDALYLPGQSQDTRASLLLVRGRGGEGQISSVLQEIAATKDGAQVYPLREFVDLDRFLMTFVSSLSWLLGGLATLLTASGVYAAMCFLLRLRTKELAVRMVLGASGADAVRFMMRYAMQLAGIGMLIGLLLSVATSKVISSYSHDLGHLFDVAACGAALLVVSIVVIAAAAKPALHAASVELNEVLRMEQL